MVNDFTRITASEKMLDKIEDIYKIIELLSTAYIDAGLALDKLQSSDAYAGEYTDDLIKFYSCCTTHISTLNTLYSKAYKYSRESVLTIIEQDSKIYIN